MRRTPYNLTMALTEEQKRRIEEEEKKHISTTAYKDSSIQSGKAKHGLPALLSFFIPGLGQIIKGQVGKGVLCFFGVGIGLVFLVIPGVIIWVWQVADAYNN